MNNNEEIYSILLAIKQEQGEIKGELRALRGLSDRVGTLEQETNQSKGWKHAVGALVSAVVAFVVSNWGAFFHAK